MLRWILLTLFLGLLPAGLLPGGQPMPPPEEQPLPPGPVPPAPPRITGATKYPPHSLVRLRAENVDAKSAILWRIYPGQGTQRATTVRGLLEFAAHPGTYEIELLVIFQTAVGLDVQEARATVTIDSCLPPPPGPPAPPSPPTPPTPPDRKPDAMQALGRIQFGSAGCSATVMSPQRPDGRWHIATAAHCITSVGQQGSMKLRGGRSFTVQVIAFDRKADLAWLITTTREDDLPFAVLAAQVPPNGTPIWHAGYGIDNPGNREEGTVIGQPNGLQGQINMMMSVSSGDSGGGIFRSDTNELISTVCCTAIRGARASMYGGSCVRLRSLLNEAVIKSIPDPYGLDQSFNWMPLEIPLWR